MKGQHVLSRSQYVQEYLGDRTSLKYTPLKNCTYKNLFSHQLHALERSLLRFARPTREKLQEKNLSVSGNIRSV